MDYGKRLQLLVRFGYDGWRFHGLQPQADLPTAGAALYQRFIAAGVTPKALCYSARTDAGVHAVRNIATLWLRGPVKLDAIIKAVGQERDDGLRQVSLERIPIHVHARSHARGKHYRYHFVDACTSLPTIHGKLLKKSDAWEVYPRLDATLMHRAAQTLVGTHDFSAFRVRRCGASDPIRTLSRLSVERCGERIILDIHGRSFLRKMVRMIAGTLALVGARWWDTRQVHSILNSRDRQHAGPIAPAHGLTLMQVHFNWPETMTNI
ncbi:MAG: tRNA pseudouridine(38-40) synthase TruA [Myxococcota bacterium]